MRKYFTLAEANAVLPSLEHELELIQNIKQSFEDKYAQHAELKKQNEDSSVLFSIEGEMEFLQMEARLHIQNINNSGAQLKDIDLGLIDFPSRKDGEDVLLCWKQGERAISHYHGLNEGFAGRKEI